MISDDALYDSALSNDGPDDEQDSMMNLFYEVQRQKEETGAKDDALSMDCGSSVNAVSPACDGTSCVRDLPRVLLRLVRQAFPDARNNTDALVAFLCTCNPVFLQNNSLRANLTQSQMDLIRRSPDNSYMTLIRRLDVLQDKLGALAKDHAFLKIVTLFTLFDRLGYRLFEFDTLPEGTFNLNEGGHFLEFLRKMESTVKEIDRVIKLQDGRPHNF